MSVEQRAVVNDCRIELQTRHWNSSDYVPLRPEQCSFSLTLGVARGQDHGMWRIGGAATEIATGHCGIIEAHAPVDVRLRPGIKRSLVCSTDNAHFCRLTGLSEGWFEASFVDGLLNRDAGAQRILLAMADELSTPRFSRELALEGYTFILFSEILRLISPERPGTRSGRTLTDLQLKMVSELVGDDLSRKLSIAAVAASLGLGVRTFTRLFKATTGTSFRAFVEEARLRKALELLTHTQLPLKAIAPAVGLSSENYLSTAVRRHTGMSPGALRRATTIRLQ